MKKADIAKLDKLWSKVVREKAKHKCESCLRTAEEWAWLNAAHIVGRVCRTTRWGVKIDDKYDTNGMCLCKSCHDQYDQHLEKEDFIRRIVIGIRRYDKLRSCLKVIAKYQDYREIRKGLLDELKTE